MTFPTEFLKCFPRLPFLCGGHDDDINVNVFICKYKTVKRFNFKYLFLQHQGNQEDFSGESVCRLYEVGRPKKADGEEDEEEEQV